MEEKLAEELTDVITVCTSWLHALGYNEEESKELQRRINEEQGKRVLVSMNMKTFVQERDEACIAMVMNGDRTKMDAHCRKYGVDMPKDEMIVMAGACKAILASTSKYIQAKHRDKAIAWLQAHGMRLDIYDAMLA